MVEEKERVQLTVLFSEEAVGALEDMAKEEGVTKGELIRRAINFYQVKLKAKKENRRIILEGENEPERVWVMI